jgi:hypothetical protein
MQSRFQFLIEAVKAHHSDECLVWPYARVSAGYGNIKHKGRYMSVHRLAYSIFVRRIRVNKLIRHSCDNPPCFNPRHLLSGTHRQNSREMVERGRSSRGVGRPAAKLTDAKVRKIRMLRCDGFKLAELAKMFKVSYFAIEQVLNGKRWKHVTQ